MALERTRLLDDPFDLVVPHGHPLAGRSSVTLGELAGQTWIGGTPDGAYARIVLSSCRAAGFEPRVVFGSDDYHAVQAFVAVGLGVAMLPRLALTAPRPGLARVALDDPPVREIAAAGWRPASAPRRPRRCSACSRSARPHRHLRNRRAGADGHRPSLSRP